MSGVTGGDNLIVRARQFFERLNEVPEAARYLRLWDRCAEFRVAGGPTFHFEVSGGRLRVLPGACPAGATGSVLATDAGSLDEILRGRLSFTAAGAGQVGRLRCVGGQASFPDLSWVGVLTRLAQENR